MRGPRASANATKEFVVPRSIPTIGSLGNVPGPLGEDGDAWSKLSCSEPDIPNSLRTHEDSRAPKKRHRHEKALQITGPSLPTPHRLPRDGTPRPRQEIRTVWSKASARLESTVIRGDQLKAILIVNRLFRGLGGWRRDRAGESTCQLFEAGADSRLAGRCLGHDFCSDGTLRLMRRIAQR